MSSPPTGPIVTLSANTTIGGQTITINTGDIRKLRESFVFSLTAPVKLGTINNFLDWIGQKIHVTLTVDQLESYAADLPQSLQADFLDMLRGEVTITAFNVDVHNKFYKIGVSYDFPPPGINLEVLNLEGIGLLVQENGNAGGSP